MRFLTFIIFFFGTNCIFAQSWADDLFPLKKHDFGKVAIGSDTRFAFRFQNIYEEELHIAKVSSTCHCTDPSILKNNVKTHDYGEIGIRFNTSGQFTREKGATVTIVFDKPYYAEVQLQISGYIRPDVVITPGSIDFGTVREGKSVSQKVTMDFAQDNGSPLNWGLTAIKQSNPYVTAKAVEKKRSGGEVQYEITITLKDNAPVGYIKDALRFVTNEKQQSANGQNEYIGIALPVHAAVTAPMYAKPSPFSIGIIGPTETVTKNLLLRGMEPFKIISVKSDDARFRFAFADDKNSIHLIPVTFSSSNAETSRIRHKIVIQTDQKDQEFITVDIFGHCFAKESDLYGEKQHAIADSPIPHSEIEIVETASPDKTPIKMRLIDTNKYANSAAVFENVSPPKQIIAFSEGDKKDENTEKQPAPSPPIIQKKPAPVKKAETDAPKVASKTVENVGAIFVKPTVK